MNLLQANCMNGTKKSAAELYAQYLVNHGDKTES